MPTCSASLRSVDAWYPYSANRFMPARMIASRVGEPPSDATILAAKSGVADVKMDGMAPTATGAAPFAAPSAVAAAAARGARLRGVDARVAERAAGFSLLIPVPLLRLRGRRPAC